MQSEYFGNIDTPIPAHIGGAEISISGWAMDRQGRRFAAIELACGGQIWAARLGIERPDVAIAHPAHQDGGESGFALTPVLPSGNARAELYGVTMDGNRITLESYTVTVDLAPLKAMLETPSSRSVETGLVRFSGWCCHPQHRILEVSLDLADKTEICKFGLERNDVAEAYPGWPAADRSGFELTIQLKAGSHPMRLRALLANGEMLSLALEVPLSVRDPAIWVVATQRVTTAYRFARFACMRALAWREARGRLPTLAEMPRLVARATQTFRQREIAEQPAFGAPEGFEIPTREEAYDSWLRCNQWNARRNAELVERLARLRHPPILSVVMPVYNPPLEFLEIAIASVKRQVYDNWELCIADDCSSDPAVREFLISAAAADPRIKTAFRRDNGNISHATNSAAELATGEFIALLDNDDELTPDALGEIALYITAHPEADVLYSDDDKIGAAGNRFAPQFKPDWSPELLLSYMYFSHLFVVRRSLFNAVGGMRPGFEGSQDYDLALRATEHARHVGHIPRVLYHWRVLPGSTAQSGNAKPASIGAGLRAVQEAVTRRGMGAEVIQPAWAQRDGLGIFALDFSDDGPAVTIIIPTRNSVEILKACLASLKRTTYRNYEVVIVDNESNEAESVEFLERCACRVLRVENPSGGFNFAYLNNRAVQESGGELVMFLNNDTEVKDPRWLSRMVGYARLPGVGAVGARLLYPDGRIQHAGIVHGHYRGMAGPAHKLLPSWHNGYLSYAAVARNYLAVTAACLLMPRTLFQAVGGFDERTFGVAYNDVDLCYRLVDKGYRCVYSAGSELVHHEGLSRGFDDKPAEEAAFKRKYGHLVDPYYNANLSLDNERFDILPRASELRRPAGPIRTLMVAFNLNLEGAPYSQYELTVGLKLLGVIDPVVFCPEDGPLRALYEAAGIEVIHRPHPLLGVFDIAEYEVAIGRFSDLVRQCSAQVVYGNTLQTFYAIDAANRLGLPSIWNPRESEPWQTYFANFGDPIACKALQCFQFPYRVVFVSDATRQGCERLNSRNNFMTIHNGLDPARAQAGREKFPRRHSRDRLGLDDQDLMVLLLGTVCERKGQIDLVDAARRLAEMPAANRLKLFIVGDREGAYSTRMHNAVALLPPHQRARVTIVAETRDAALFLSAADIFVCTSRVESYPRVILEAMFYGHAIVTTAVFGIAEQLSDRISALFYTPGDANQLAGCLERIATDDALRTRLSDNAGLRLARLTSFDEMLQQYADCFSGAYYAAPRSQETDYVHPI